MDLHLSTYLLFTLLIFFSFLIVQKRKRANNNQSAVPKLPPGPWKLPVLGSLHHLLGSPLPHHSLRDLSKRHGPLMHLQLGEVSTVVVSSPEAAKEILKTQGLNFASRPEIQSMKLGSYGFKDIAMGPYGANWRQLRRICHSELLSAQRVKSLRFIMEEEVSNLTQTISMSVNHPVNLSKLTCAAINNMTARAVFGDRWKCQEVFLAAMSEVLRLVGGLRVEDLFPSFKMLPVITGMKSKLEELHLKFDGIFSDIIEEHRMKYETGKKKLDESFEDLVDVLLRLQRDGDLEIPLSDDRIKAVILDVFFGGTESATTILLWAMSELMRNPDTLAKAQEEVRRVLRGMKTISESNFKQLNYLKSIIKETLRLHPPGPLLVPRECRQSCEVNGYLIPTGTRVITNAWAIARDAQYWGDDSESFKPERFLNNPVDFMGANFEFIPFGVGRRICPGITYGLASVELPLAQLLHDFNWELPDGMKPNELDMVEQFGAAVVRRTDLRLVPLPYDMVGKK